jgi:hypothetical protein
VRDIDPIQRRLVTARHEIGHVVPMLVHGIPFKNVEILMPHEMYLAYVAKHEMPPNLGFVLHEDGGLCLGLVRNDRLAFILQGCQFPAEDQIVQLMAGVAGEQIDHQKPIWRKKDGRNKGDYNEAMDILSHISIHTRFSQTLLRPYFFRAWEFLQQYKVEHAALVAALLDKTILTYAECVAIWEASRG